MPRPLVLIHGYSAEGRELFSLRSALQSKGIAANDINICNYVSLNNEISIKDIAEGLERAFRVRKMDGEFDAIVHSTGMLVLRAWLTNDGAPPERNARLARLKHMIGLAPATWGSPQAHKGRTWLGAMVKGNRHFGPDFMDAGDEVLDGLELGSKFTWELAHRDLLGEKPYYDNGAGTPFVAVFIGNRQYDGVASAANDPGTDGTVRWAGCGLNTRKITIDLTRPSADQQRLKISPWAANRLDVPIIAVDGRNHGSIVSEPEDGMVDLVADFLKVGDPGGRSYNEWIEGAREYGKRGLPAMQINPGAGAGGLGGEFKKYLGDLTGHKGETMEGWQQFVIWARDERGDGIADYVIEILTKDEDGQWVRFKDMFTDVHAYGADSSYRCFHVRLPHGVSSTKVPVRARIHASTGTQIMGYQGYQDDTAMDLTQAAQAVEIELNDLGKGNGSLFWPFTTTLIEIILNREPVPFDQECKILTFLPSM